MQRPGLWARGCTCGWGCVDTSWVFCLLLIHISHFSAAPGFGNLRAIFGHLHDCVLGYGWPSLLGGPAMPTILKCPQQWHTEAACPPLVTRELQLRNTEHPGPLIQGVSNLWDLMPGDLRWSWCNNSRNKSESASHSVLSDSLQPSGLSPSRLLCPWDSPGKNNWSG